MNQIPLFIAQAANAPTTTAVKIQSVWDMVVKGGPVMVPLIATSLIALAVIIERLISLRRKNVIPPGFLPGLQAIIAGGGQERQALEYCAANNSPFARIVKAGIKHQHESVELLEKRVEEAGQREVFKLRKYLRVLSAICSASTLMGLLGTTIGLVNTFGTVASSSESLGKTELMAKGIYEAMICTATGLAIAITTLLFYHAISGKVEGLVAEMDELTVDFLEQNGIRRTRQAPPLRVSEAPEPALVAG
jgi:biopolymer transport protein ExbB